jgi:hypothetical protein
VSITRSLFFSQGEILSGVDFFNLAIFPSIYARIAERVGSAKQKDVATALGITQAHINNLLAVAKGKQLTKGPTTLPFKQLIEWARSAGVSIDWLLTGQEPNAEGEAPSPGQACLDFPPWDTRPLEPKERVLLQEALDVLRSPGLSGKWDESLAGNIRSARTGVAIEAGRPRCHEPPLEPQGGQKQASEGGQQSKRRAAKAG